MTKIFFDTEFTGLHQNTTLVSIGLIADNGALFYAELNDYDVFQTNDWLRKNVINNLKLQSNFYREIPLRDPYSQAPMTYDVYADCNMKELKVHLSKWLEQFDTVEMWSDCLAYDWVLFCQIWGGALNIPKNVYYIPFDICHLFKDNGFDPDISREVFVKEELSGPKNIIISRLVTNFDFYSDKLDNYFDLDSPIDLDVKINFEELKHNSLFDAIVIYLCYFKLIKK